MASDTALHSGKDANTMLTAVGCKYKTSVGDADRLTSLSHCAATSACAIWCLRTRWPSRSQVAKFKMTKRGLCSPFYGGCPFVLAGCYPALLYPTTRKVLNSGSGEPLGGKVLNWILKVSKKVFDAKKGAVHIFPNQHSIHWCLLPSCLTLSLKKRLFTI